MPVSTAGLRRAVCACTLTPSTVVMLTLNVAAAAISTLRSLIQALRIASLSAELSHRFGPFWRLPEASASGSLERSLSTIRYTDRMDQELARAGDLLRQARRRA